MIRINSVCLAVSIYIIYFFFPLRVRKIDRLDQLMFFPAMKWNVLKQRIQTIYVANCVHSFSKIQSNI